MAAARILLFVIAALVLPVGVLSALNGEYRFGLSGLLIGGGALLLATWAWGFTTVFHPRVLICIGLFAAGLGLIGLWIELVTALIVFLVVVTLLNVVVSLLVARRMSTIAFERVGADEAVMPETRELVAELEAAGFRRMGGFRFRAPMRGKVLTATVLAGPASDRYAAVTEGAWEVTSPFGTRELTTASSAMSAPPPWALRQIVGAGSAELLAAHQSAVEHLARRGLAPDRFEQDDQVVDAALASVQRASRFIATAPTRKVVYPGFPTRRADPVLDDDERSRRRIDAWLEPQPEPA